MLNILHSQEMKTYLFRQNGKREVVNIEITIASWETRCVSLVVVQNLYLYLSCPSWGGGMLGIVAEILLQKFAILCITQETDAKSTSSVKETYCILWLDNVKTIKRNIYKTPGIYNIKCIKRTSFKRRKVVENSKQFTTHF